MDREIKFRAWDAFQNTMHYGVESGIYEDPDEIISFDKILGFACYEVMQYTGLKDKNDKEIYEGDIVDFRKGEKRLYIAFNNGQWNMCGNINNPDNDYRHLDHYVKHDGPIEVIGNIYENPELLKEE